MATSGRRLRVYGFDDLRLESGKPADREWRRLANNRSFWRAGFILMNVLFAAERCHDP